MKKHKYCLKLKKTLFQALLRLLPKYSLKASKIRISELRCRSTLPPKRIFAGEDRGQDDILRHLTILLYNDLRALSIEKAPFFPCPFVTNNRKTIDGVPVLV